MTFRKFYILAASAGLKPYQTDRMYVSDVWVQIEGYNDRIENLEKLEWNRTRAVAYIVYLSIPEKKGKVKKSIERFMPFKWDKEGKKKLSPKEIREQWERNKKNKE